MLTITLIASVGYSYEMEPGETEQFTENTQIPFDFNRVSFRIQGDNNNLVDGRYISAERPNNDINVRLRFELTLSQNARVGQEIRVTLNFSFFGNVGMAWSEIPIVINVIRGQAPDISLSDGNIDFGEVTVDQRSDEIRLQVYNRGNSELRISSTAIVNNDQFRISRGSGAVNINPNQSHSLYLVFEPDEEGQHEGRLRISSNSPGENTVYCNLSGIGIPDGTPDIDLSEDEVEFGDVPVGQISEEICIRVFNRGDRVLSLSSTSIIGNDQFRISRGGGSFDIDPDQYHPVYVIFEPTEDGLQQARIRFSSNSPGESNIYCALTGTGRLYSPVISTEEELRFGEVAVNSSRELPLNIQNIGTGDLIITDIGCLFSDIFTVSIELPLIIEEGANQTIPVVFTPIELGTCDAWLRIVSNDFENQEWIIGVVGTGAQPNSVNTEDNDPVEFLFGNPFPNPFNSTVTIPFTLPVHANVSLSVLDLTGRTVANLVNRSLNAGSHSVNWTADGVETGAYFVMMQVNEQTFTHRVLLVK